MAGPTQTSTLDLPWLADMKAWINNPSTPMYGRWNHPPPPGNPNAPGEGGVDLAAPGGTPVYALADGPLLSANTFASQGFNHPGSVVAQRVNVPGVGAEDIYYQHVDLFPGIGPCLGGNCGGQILQAGQRIGTVNSTAGETEIGFNPNWGSLYGPSKHPGPWPSDPRPWIKALILNGPTEANTVSATGNPTSSIDAQGNPVCQPWDIPCMLKSINLTGGLQRIGEGILGGVLLIIGLLLAVKQISGIKMKTIAKVMK